MPSANTDELQRGTIDHQEHSEHVERSTQRDSVLTGVMTFGVLVLVAIILCVLFL